MINKAMESVIVISEFEHSLTTITDSIPVTFTFGQIPMGKA